MATITPANLPNAGGAPLAVGDPSPATTSAIASNLSVVASARLRASSPESRYVHNTIDFRELLEGAEFGSNRQTELVRKFLEGGGLRGESRPVSERLYSSVLHLGTADGGPIEITTGSHTVTDNGSQYSAPTTITLQPGLYRFDYNTEHGVTLHNLNNPQDVVQLTLGGEPGGALQLNATANKANTHMLAQAIINTSRLYQDNSAEAELMEGLITKLYQGGQFSPTLASNQDPAALEKIQGAVRTVIGQADPSTRAVWARDIYDMVHPEPQVLGRHDQALINSIQQELDLTGPASELRVGFGAHRTSTPGFDSDMESDRIDIYLYNPTHFEALGHNERPVIMYQLSNLSADSFSSINSQSWQPSLSVRDGLRYRKDFDNQSVSGEQPVEAALAAAVPDGGRAPSVYAIEISGGNAAKHLRK